MNQTLKHNDCYTQQYGEDDILWMQNVKYNTPDSKVLHWSNMGSTWVLSAPDGPHVGPMNFNRETLVDMYTRRNQILLTH